MTVNTQELRELAEKATPGKWVADGKAVSSDHGHRTSICGTYGIAWPCGSYSNAEADAALIAAARNALPALLDEIDALRAELQARQWMPIETAPHDQEVLLGWYEWDGAWKAEVGMASWGWRTARVNNISLHGRATHWQTLPPAPPQGDGAC